MRFPRASRLTERRQFLAVQGRGARLHTGDYVVLALPNACGRVRFGATVSAKVGNAVVRNRVKRWLRVAFREVAEGWPGEDDLVLIARSTSPGAGLEGTRRAFAMARRARRPAAGPRGRR